jgi:hypothetical protein
MERDLVGLFVLSFFRVFVIKRVRAERLTVRGAPDPSSPPTWRETIGYDQVREEESR